VICIQNDVTEKEEKEEARTKNCSDEVEFLPCGQSGK